MELAAGVLRQDLLERGKRLFGFMGVAEMVVRQGEAREGAGAGPGVTGLGQRGDGSLVEAAAGLRGAK